MCGDGRRARDKLDAQYAIPYRIFCMTTNKVKPARLIKSKPGKPKKKPPRRNGSSIASVGRSKNIKLALTKALMRDDLKTFKAILVSYLRKTPKTALSARTKLGRQTLYDLINGEREFNPSLTTLGSILKALGAE
jgi:DNA-binding phage protein